MIAELPRALAEALARWLAWRAPRRLVYWILLRALAAETDRRGSPPPETVTIWHALDRWNPEAIITTRPRP